MFLVYKQQDLIQIFSYCYLWSIYNFRYNSI